MSKQKPITSSEAEDLLGGGSLLDRIGRGAPVVEEGRASKKAEDKQEIEAPALEDEDGKLIKVSLYLSPEEVNALDAQIMKRRKAQGRSPRRTHLIREAIHDWLKQQS